MRANLKTTALATKDIPKPIASHLHRRHTTESRFSQVRLACQQAHTRTFRGRKAFPASEGPTYTSGSSNMSGMPSGWARRGTVPSPNLNAEPIIAVSAAHSPSPQMRTWNAQQAQTSLPQATPVENVSPAQSGQQWQATEPSNQRGSSGKIRKKLFK